MGRRARVVTAPVVPAACLAISLPLRERRPRPPEDTTPPLLQALSAWGESRVFCLLSRSCGVPRHKSASPLLQKWRASDTVICPVVSAPPSPPQDCRGPEHSL
ncbi:hypothetical protein NDU88_011956 [Pleurodeles waltl]|uniref:Secreted protein n=1 Tax=Pleurodeles waltl TaxID=8319 RepID=A0AAV7S6X8_PLEWA|nr:hypothetical protein NDU88_011956 [Pleurodeles waltl]